MQSLQVAHQHIENPDAHYLILAGPTAVGKTELVLKLAQKVDLEVISADSRQVYRGMDIGTATPELEILERVPHHFINELEPSVTWNAGTFYKTARERINNISHRCRLPVVVGGAGLYLEALQYGFFSEGLSDPEVRTRYEMRLANIGAERLWNELRAIDPEYADTFHYNDHKKLVRAFEILKSSGRIPTEAFKVQDDVFGLQGHMVILSRARPELYQRIDERVLIMIQQGLVEECRTLLNAGYGPELYPLRTIGYKEVFAFLDGKCSEGEMIADMQKHTRNFAKRQLTWFRNHSYDQWIDL